MTPHELKKRMQELREAVDSLREYWADLFPELECSERQLRTWLRLYPNLGTIVDGLEAASQQVNRLGQKGHEMDADSVIRFASGCMKRTTQIENGEFRWPDKGATDATSSDFEVGEE